MGYIVLKYKVPFQAERVYTGLVYSILVYRYMEQTRRQFLKRFAQSAVGLFTVNFSSALFALPSHDYLASFMRFSAILTAENDLNPEFGKLCWRYVQSHSQASHMAAMLQFLAAANAQSQQNMLDNNSDLKSIAYHTLIIWYKGDLTSISHTQAEAKLAYLEALKWKAIGTPARGLCRENWSKACTM